MIDSSYDIAHPSSDNDHDDTPILLTPPVQTEALLSAIPEELAEFIALLLVPQDQFDRCVRKGKPPKVKLCADNVLAVLALAVEKCLARYSTSISDDTALIVAINSGQPHAISGRAEMAVRVRLGEKVVLQNWINILSSRQIKRPRAGSDSHEESGNRSIKKAHTSRS